MRWNLALAGLAASWGFVALIVARVELPAEVLAFLRLSIAALTIVLAAGAARRLGLLRLPVLRAPVLALGVGLAAHWFLFFETIKLASVAVAVLTVYTAPVFLTLLAPLVLPERRSAVAVGALVPGAGGIALIALAGDGETHVRPLAIATGLAAALTYAVLVIVTKYAAAQLPVVAIQFWNYLAASLALAPFLMTAERVLPRGGEWGYVLLLGAALTALSGFFYVWLLRKVSAQAAGILGYLEPVSAAVLAWVLLGQPLGAAVIAGGFLIITAGLLVVLYEPEQPPPVEAPALVAHGKEPRSRRF